MCQVMLLNTVRDVCGSLVGLLIHAKNANGQPLEHPAYGQVSDYSKVERYIEPVIKSMVHDILFVCYRGSLSISPIC